jgi:predicted component of type VI protein secretion system
MYVMYLISIYTYMMPTLLNRVTPSISGELKKKQTHPLQVYI